MGPAGTHAWGWLWFGAAWLVVNTLTGCSEASETSAALVVQSRWPLTPEAQGELEACVADFFPDATEPKDSEVKDATSLCEAMLGIGSKGTTRVTYDSVRPPPNSPPTTPPSATPRPVPPEWQQQICGLERGDGEAELTRFLGLAPYRTELAGEGLLLQWEEGNAGVTAEFDAEGLKQVTAISENRFPKLCEKTALPDHWKVNVTRLSEVEALRIGR